MNNYYGFGDWLQRDPNTKMGGLARDAWNMWQMPQQMAMAGIKGEEYNKPEFNNKWLNPVGDAYGAVTGLAMGKMGLPQAQQGQGLETPEDNSIQNQNASNYMNYMNSFAAGGYSSQSQTGGKGNDYSYYENGGTHEANPYGGIPIGNNSFVEEGEFKFRDPDTKEEYIFSNRF